MNKFEEKNNMDMKRILESDRRKQKRLRGWERRQLFQNPTATARVPQTVEISRTN